MPSNSAVAVESKRSCFLFCLYPIAAKNRVATKKIQMRLLIMISGFIDAPMVCIRVAPNDGANRRNLSGAVVDGVRSQRLRPG